MTENEWEAYLDEDLSMTAEIEFVRDRLTDRAAQNEAESFPGPATNIVGVAYGDRRVRRPIYTTESISEETTRPNYEDMTRRIMENYRELEDTVRRHIDTNTEEFYDELESFVSERLERKLEESDSDTATVA